MRTVPVFMYHHINRNAGDMITLTPKISKIICGFLGTGSFGLSSLKI